MQGDRRRGEIGDAWARGHLETRRSFLTLCLLVVTDTGLW